MKRTILALLLVACQRESSPRSNFLDGSAPAPSCDAGDPKLCLEDARAQLGAAPERVLVLAEKACKLDPHVSIPGARGEELSCQFFDRDAAERAQQLSRGCDAAEARACRAWGDFIGRYDAARARSAYQRGCTSAGVGASDLERCVEFPQMLARAPACPATRSLTAFTYLQCPSDATRAPHELAPVSVEASVPSVATALRQLSGQLSLCHTARVLEGPGATRTLRLRVLIDQHGDVAALESEPGSSANRYELDCLVRQIATLRLSPAPEQATWARLELTLG